MSAIDSVRSFVVDYSAAWVEQKERYKTVLCALSDPLHFEVSAD